MTSEMSVAMKAIVSELAKAISRSLVVEQLLVVFEREAAPNGVAFAVVEAEGDQRDERRIEEEEDGEQPERASATCDCIREVRVAWPWLDPVTFRGLAAG